ncbi:MAG: hypothetical protein RI911_358 [Candidatus Parcubacteria bacterium]|jgi:tryptophan-rich sensory protein
MDTPTALWYATLIKPSWAPPVYLFGPVWTVLYIIIIITFGYVCLKWYRGEISWIIALPFLLNIVANILFTPLQFGLQSNELASLDILVILGTLGWALFVIFPIVPWVAYANIPYFLWVSFATVLQLTITYLNW